VDNLNEPAQASFTTTCTNLSCVFDASGSSDSDGDIVGYAWDFGDGNGGSGPNTGHTYGVAGTYNVLLTVTDDDDATGSENQSLTVHDVSPTTMHVGDLEGTGDNMKKNWHAQVSIAVHDAYEGLVAGAEVDGSWSGDASGSGNCTTGSDGACNVFSDSMPKKGTDKAIFSVTAITHASVSYFAADNHDPQGNSSGTAIQVNKDGITKDPGLLANQPPVASFAYNCDEVSLTCTFDATGSSDPDGVFTDYAWDFGDGNAGNGLTTTHIFSVTGVYAVVITVTDDAGVTAQDRQDFSFGLTLAATGYKVKGVHHAYLAWSGASSTNIDIFRDGTHIGTMPSGDGSYTDNIGQKGGGSYVYQLCEEGTSTCSNEAFVEF